MPRSLPFLESLLPLSGPRATILWSSCATLLRTSDPSTTLSFYPEVCIPHSYPRGPQCTPLSGSAKVIDWGACSGILGWLGLVPVVPDPETQCSFVYASRPKPNKYLFVGAMMASPISLPSRKKGCMWTHSSGPSTHGNSPWISCTEHRKACESPDQKTALQCGSEPVTLQGWWCQQPSTKMSFHMGTHTKKCPTSPNIVKLRTESPLHPLFPLNEMCLFLCWRW